MTRSQSKPGRPASGRPGVFLSVALLLLAGCDRLPVIGGGAEVELEEGSVSLPDGADLHEVRVSSNEGPAIEPARIEAAPGDAVQFAVGDDLGHALAFELESLDPAARSFLEESGQTASPPLLTEGTRWVISLEGAPAGTYAIRCMTHDERAVLEVAAAR